jgi:hypothetical protein
VEVDALRMLPAREPDFVTLSCSRWRTPVIPPLSDSDAHVDWCPARKPHLMTISHEGGTSMILVPAEAKSYKTRQARQLSAR